MSIYSCNLLLCLVINDGDSCFENGCSEGCVELPWNQMSIYRCICITENDTDSCSESGCSEGCVELPWNQMSIYRCICYDGAAKVLQEDEKTCASKINSKTFLKGPLKNRQNKGLKDKW